MRDVNSTVRILQEEGIEPKRPSFTELRYTDRSGIYRTSNIGRMERLRAILSATCLATT